MTATTARQRQWLVLLWILRCSAFGGLHGLDRSIRHFSLRRQEAYSLRSRIKRVPHWSCRQCRSRVCRSTRMSVEPLFEEQRALFLERFPALRTGSTGVGHPTQAVYFVSSTSVDLAEPSIKCAHRLTEKHTYIWQIAGECAFQLLRSRHTTCDWSACDAFLRNIRHCGAADGPTPTSPQKPF